MNKQDAANALKVAENLKGVSTALETAMAELTNGNDRKAIIQCMVAIASLHDMVLALFKGIGEAME